MGTITREATAPIADGETASGTEVEAEFNKIFTEFNGNIEDVNVAAAAAISGSKLADASIANAKMVGSTLTTASMNASAVTKGNLQSASDLQVVTTSTTLVDVPSMTGITLTPGSTSDMIVLDFMATVRRTATPGTLGLIWGFNVNGSDVDDIARYSWTDSEYHVVNVSYMVAAGGTSAQSFRPRYKRAGGSTIAGEFTVDQLRLFRAVILPIK